MPNLAVALYLNLRPSFKGAHFPKDVILFAVFVYQRYGVSYRDLGEIVAERGVAVEHATLNRWVERYSGQVAEAARRSSGLVAAGALIVYLRLDWADCKPSSCR